MVFILLGVGYIFVFGSYSDGYRAGRIMKLSHKGIIFKTYEGQLDIGGLDNGGSDGAATTVWNFSVKDQDVVKEINDAVDDGASVKLYYREKYFTFVFWGDTKYFVYKVEKTKTENRVILIQPQTKRACVRTSFGARIIFRTRVKMVLKRPIPI